MSAITELEVSKSGWVSGTIKDRDGTAFEPTTLKLSIYDKATLRIVNSRDHVALAPATDAPGGVIGFRLAIADQAISVTGNESEEHIMRIDFTWNAGLDAAYSDVTYTVYAQPILVAP